MSVAHQPTTTTDVMSQDIGKTRTPAGLGSSLFEAGLVATGRVELQVPENFAGVVLDHADLELGDDQHDPSVLLGG